MPQCFRGTVMGYQKGYFDSLERQRRRIEEKAFRDTARRLARIDVQKRRWDAILSLRKQTGYWPDVANQPK